MKFDQFLDRINGFVTESGIQVTEEILACVDMCSRTLSSSITENDPTLLALSERGESRPLSGETVLDDKIAREALEELNAFLREKKAGVNFERLLNSNEKLTFSELLDAFELFAGETDKLREYVSRRDYMRNISTGSPLRVLIECMLERRDNYAEVLERELQESGLQPVEIHGKDAIAIIGRFKELLQECMTVA